MHPYKSLDEKYFWAPAVGQRDMLEIAQLWDPKFRIGKRMQISTYGSCFAQHIGRALSKQGFNWFIAEPAPEGLSAENAKRFNYGIFSARTGNIYTVSLLKQWLGWASGAVKVPEEVWQKDGRFYDPFRPNIEPDGFASEAEVKASREMAIQAFKRSIVEADLFVFTLGLTESWFHKQHGYEYPMCPGTVAGEYDPDAHEFVNQDYSFIRKTLAEAVRAMKELNPKLRFLLTVSPVPLTATMSGNHVLVATVESKSILRAVAGNLKQRFPFVDYFPSYEIISSPPFRGAFFEANQRSVKPEGVAHVMKMFFKCLGLKFASEARGASARLSDKVEGEPIEPAGPGRSRSQEDIVCEEELLGAFGPKK